jgi:oligopeptide/dipeptide ABC transporter ATP-binding protein
LQNNLVQILNLKKYFRIKKGIFFKTNDYIKAVDNVKINIEANKTLGLVGESGSGKTTLSKCILKLLNPDEGKIIFDGIDITNYSMKQMIPLRKRMQIIFQDPYSSLNPRFTVLKTILEGMNIHKIYDIEKRYERVHELLNMVGLNDNDLNKFPHEFSGGQRQRIVIARALSLNPDFIVCDEPVSSLDVSIQSQIINLLKDLQMQLNLTYLFISHNLAVIRNISDDIAIMYLGQIVEYASSEKIFLEPKHPYTKALLNATPEINPDKKPHRIVLKGNIPSASKIPNGCRFHPRCPEKIKECSYIEPVLSINESHQVRCLLYKECFPDII